MSNGMKVETAPQIPPKPYVIVRPVDHKVQVPLSFLATNADSD